VSSHEQSLAQRRQELVSRSAAQRAALIADAEPLLRKAAAADRILSKVRQYPALVALAGGAIAFFGSRRLLGLVVQTLTLYRLFRR
jgi:YqjK-like protein